MRQVLRTQRPKAKVPPGEVLELVLLLVWWILVLAALYAGGLAIWYLSRPSV